MNTTPDTTSGIWRSLVTDRPDSHRRILCSYRGTTRAVGDWLWCVAIYYPDTHRIFVNNEPWLGDMIKRKDVHWMELPLAPDGEAASAIR